MAAAAGFATLQAVTGGRSDVLAVARDVQAGQVLTADDLRTVQVAAGSGVVAAGRAEQVVGRVAAVPLASGALLAPGQFSKGRGWPPKGYAEFSFAAEKGAAPPRLSRGERVAVYPGPDGAGLGKAGGEEAEKADGEGDAAPVVGTVTGVKAADSAGSDAVRVVTVLVPEVASERAVGMEHPRVVVLSPGGGERQ
ncbi:SAF domain-containing protein [Streptomyces boninensis]|uniref:SAF domain-containing protein n=1 Tax=Streptomyces boninensis TaxID=2039455 RepID=UPI003B22851F